MIKKPGLKRPGTKKQQVLPCGNIEYEELPRQQVKVYF